MSSGEIQRPRHVVERVSNKKTDASPACWIDSEVIALVETIDCYHIRMATRTTFTLEESLAEQARELGVNISAAARQGVAAAVRAALAENDRTAYERHPEEPESFWTEAEAWGSE